MAYWSRPLPERVRVKTGAELRTLACVRAVVLALPEHRQAMQHWQAVAKLLLEAAEASTPPPNMVRQISYALLHDGMLWMPPTSEKAVVRRGGRAAAR